MCCLGLAQSCEECLLEEQSSFPYLLSQLLSSEQDFSEIPGQSCCHIHYTRAESPSSTGRAHLELSWCCQGLILITNLQSPLLQLCWWIRMQVLANTGTVLPVKDFLRSYTDPSFNDPSTAGLLWECSYRSKSTSLSLSLPCHALLFFLLTFFTFQI